MKKSIKFLCVMFVIVISLSCVGCAKTVDWDSIPRDSVMAESGSLYVSKKSVSLQFAINDYTNGQVASMFGELGNNVDAEKETFESAVNSMSAYLILANVAEKNGMMLTEEEAKEQSYTDFVLLAKKSPDIAAYAKEIKSILHLSDDMLVDYGTEYDRIIKSAEAYVKSEYEKLDASEFEDLDKMAEKVNEIVNETAKDIKVTVLYPRKKTVKGSDLSFESIVTGLKWSYQSLFYDL